MIVTSYDENTRELILEDISNEEYINIVNVGISISKGKDLSNDEYFSTGINHLLLKQIESYEAENS